MREVLVSFFAWLFFCGVRKLRYFAPWGCCYGLEVFGGGGGDHRPQRPRGHTARDPEPLFLILLAQISQLFGPAPPPEADFPIIWAFFGRIGKPFLSPGWGKRKSTGCGKVRTDYMGTFFFGVEWCGEIFLTYLIFVTDATDGVRVNFFAWCKFLQI